MKYIVLLRGINVGGNRKVEMKRLRSLFESLGYASVKTYLNSGNATFESSKKQEVLQNEIPKRLKTEFGLEIQTLVKNEKEVKKIADAIPKEWENNSEQRQILLTCFLKLTQKKLLMNYQ